MEKASSNHQELTSLEEWEFLDLGGHDDDDGKDLSSPHQKLFFDPKGIIDMNYFICPSHPLPPPAHVDESCEEFVKDIPAVVPPDFQDPVSQVFFKKTFFKDAAEFADMKKTGAKLISPHVDPDPILFDEDEEEEEEGLYSPKELAEDKASSKINSAELREVEEEEEDNNRGNQLLEGIGFTVWRWRVNGIGALCSIGVAAAATVCVFILGGKQNHKQHQHQQQKIQFQIYTEDKRIKQVVQQATRLNQAISAMRGAPITRAHISFGGYYDGL